MNACPQCGSRYLRPSQSRTPKERLDQLRFITPLRCMDCQHRFIASTFTPAEWKFARCPVCFRQDLNGWTGKSYTPGFWMGLKIAFGAKRYRCEYCRINFASFLKRKESFTFRRWIKREEELQKLNGAAGQGAGDEIAQAQQPPAQPQRQRTRRRRSDAPE